MNNLEHLSMHGRRLLDRRHFLGTAGLSAAGLGLAGLLSSDGLLAEDTRTVSGETPIRPEIDPNNPAKGGFERMFIERLLDSGISGKDAIGRTTTDASGHFKFKGLAPGLYEVRAQAASGAMGFASGMLPAHGARVEVNVDIPAGDQTLKGRVLYANDKPFKGMVVASAGMAFQAAMMGQAGQVRPAYTDDDGRYELSGMPKGRYVM